MTINPVCNISFFLSMFKQVLLKKIQFCVREKLLGGNAKGCHIGFSASNLAVKSTLN